ncbi:MAG: DUF1700 domain-containing protein [Roseburia sp.]|nr:DUF1700 domain-containing protein [Roseburia sp.]
MSKAEFLEKLRLALNGRIHAPEVADNLNYYEDYINTQIRLGKSEEEVIDALGDPRLIARTIIGTSGREQQVDEIDAGAAHAQGEYWERAEKHSLKRIFRIPAWVWLIIMILAVVLILGMVFSLLSFLVPFILPLLVVLFLVKLFRDWLN